MAGISFFKVPKHRVYDYQPRYYDPEKEEREQRRRELGLADDDEPTGGYSTGSLIRGGAMRARHEQFNQKMQKQKRKSQLLLIALILGLGLITYYLMRDYWDAFVQVLSK